MQSRKETRSLYLTRDAASMEQLAKIVDHPASVVKCADGSPEDTKIDFLEDVTAQLS